MKLNVDEAMNSAGRYRVQGIPTLLLFKNGQVVEQIVGAVPKEQITKALERHIAQIKSNCGAPRSIKRPFSLPPWFHLPLRVRVLT